MRDEYISLSIAGAVGLWCAGLFAGLLLAADIPEMGHFVMMVIVLLIVRVDAREGHTPGTYRRGWFVWRRTGPVTANDPEARV